MVHCRKENGITHIQYDSLQDVFAQLEKYETAGAKFSSYVWAEKKSQSYANRKFFYFEDYSTALNTLKTGWKEGAEKLGAGLTKTFVSTTSTKTKNFYDVAGYQACVPRYLQGMPDNMINSKRIVNKQKVVTVVKHIGFLSNVNEDKIVENSIKALAIVKRLEESGTRCNIDVISPVELRNCKLSIRIRIKNSTERLNLGKVAFALANPDMLRRIIFALRHTAFDEGYLDQRYFHNSCMGATMYDRDYVIKNCLKSGEKYLHNFIDNVEDEIQEFNKIK